MTNIHDPKVHTIAIGLIAATMSYGAVQLHNVERPKIIYSAPARTSYTFTEDQLEAIPFGHHDYTIYEASNSGETPYAVADYIRRLGNNVAVEGDVLPHTGIWVSPDTPEGHAVADAISKIIGEPVKVGNDNNGAFEIGIGHPAGGNK